MQNANKNANDGDKVCICRGFALFYKGSNPSYSAKREAPESMDSGASLCVCKGFGGFCFDGLKSFFKMMRQLIDKFDSAM